MFQTIFNSSKIDWPKLEFFQVSVMYTKIVKKFVYIKVTLGECKRYVRYFNHNFLYTVVLQELVITDTVELSDVKVHTSNNFFESSAAKIKNLKIQTFEGYGQHV